VNAHNIKDVPSALQGLDADVAIAFLKSLDTDGWHNLVSIRYRGNPETKDIRGKTFAPGKWDEMRAWILAQDREANLYYSLNEPKPGSRDDKLGKADIAAIRAVAGDADPHPENSASYDDARAIVIERMAALHAGDLPPTVIVDSGGGAQPIWMLDGKLPAAGLVADVEDIGRAVARAIGGDAVQDISRILRLPGTINQPSLKKLARGQMKRATSVLHRSGRRHSLSVLAAVYAPLGNGPVVDMSPLVAEISAELEYADLHTVPPALRTRFSEAKLRHPKLNLLWQGNPEGLIGEDNSSSGWRFSLAARLGEADFTATDYAHLVLDWEIAQLDRSGIDPDAPGGLRQLARDWARGGHPRTSAFHAARWFEEPREPLFPDEPTQVARITEVAPIRWINPEEWRDKPIPPREWEVPNFIPRFEVSALYGDGGIGKTLLIHQYAICATAGVPWIGQEVRQARVMCFFCEDSEDELQRRHADILSALTLDFSATGDRLRLASRRFMDNVLATWDRQTGRMQRLAVWDRLREAAVSFRADVVIIDTLADVFAGEEQNRIQANAFIKACLGRLAQEIGGSVIVLAHPSLSGQSSGQGTSGSTAWNNSVRSRLYLRYPKGAAKGDLRELEGMKANYGPKGGLMKLRWNRGAFDVIAGTVPGSVPRMAFPNLDHAADQAVVAALLDSPGARHSPARNSPYFAPRALKRQAPEILATLTEAEIAEALSRLERRRLIRLEGVQRDGSRREVEGYVVLLDNLSGETAGAAETASIFT
jgi:hypothetical protein